MWEVTAGRLSPIGSLWPTRLPFSCTGHMHLEVGEHDHYSVVIKIPEGAVELPNSWFANCAAVIDPEADKRDNKSASTVSCHVVTMGNACVGGMVLGNAGQCECPAGTVWDGTACSAPKPKPTTGAFSVNIVKTGDQSCKPGSECHFDLDISDPGPVVHDAPVTVTDNLNGLSAAPIVSITQTSGDDPFPCSTLPTRLPFSCTGHMHLEVGEHDHYSVVIKVPEGAVELPNNWFANCAAVINPEADKRDNKSASTSPATS